MAGEENRTIHFENFNKLNEQTRPEGDFTVAEVQRSLEKSVSSCRKNLTALKTDGGFADTDAHGAPGRKIKVDERVEGRISD